MIREMLRNLDYTIPLKMDFFFYNRSQASCRSPIFLLRNELFVHVELTVDI